MAIKGRHKYQVYLNANCVEKIKDFLESVDEYENLSGGLSGFLNKYCCDMAEKLHSVDSYEELEGLLEYYRSR